MECCKNTTNNHLDMECCKNTTNNHLFESGQTPAKSLINKSKMTPKRVKFEYFLRYFALINQWFMATGPRKSRLCHNGCIR